jgi:tRNA/tmRNA/rRNA uracil-C5-methylase (TrmA/RlmC/RlmD family)
MNSRPGNIHIPFEGSETPLYAATRPTTFIKGERTFVFIPRPNPNSPLNLTTTVTTVKTEAAGEIKVFEESSNRVEPINYKRPGKKFPA